MLQIMLKLKALKSGFSKDYWNLLNSATALTKRESKIPASVFMEHFKKLGEDKSEQAEHEAHFDPRNIKHSRNETFQKHSKII